MLGNTVGLIAMEKAGIIKNNCVVISGARDQRAKRGNKEKSLENGF